VTGNPGLRIYNTEAHGSLHQILAPGPGYVASEYFGPELASGDRHPSGVLHQDLQALSFADGSFDLVISSDVFEHVPDPYRAHAEAHRVLRPGGHHVFTVPYAAGSALDQVRAKPGPDGTVEHLLPPLFHDDPVRPDEGALVFTIFGLEMIPKLARLGFDVTVYRLYDPTRGLVGDDGFVFDAARSAADPPTG
jgi:SAM-dependent methyltransferase